MKLKPCPFCGGEDVWFNTDSLAIECLDCGCDGPFAGLEKGWNVKQRAADRWNDRRTLWIPVSKELPDAETTVLITNPAWPEPVAEGFFTGDEWFTTAGRRVGHPYRIGPPTHWMHLPEPPSADSTKGKESA
jgi:hypothetical protein